MCYTWVLWHRSPKPVSKSQPEINLWLQLIIFTTMHLIITTQSHFMPPAEYRKQKIKKNFSFLPSASILILIFTTECKFNNIKSVVLQSRVRKIIKRSLLTHPRVLLLYPNTFRALLQQKASSVMRWDSNWNHLPLVLVCVKRNIFFTFFREHFFACVALKLLLVLDFSEKELTKKS